MAEVDARFANASVEFDPETLAPTYRLRLGAAGSSSALAVAARMGMPSAVLERADSLLEREDRRLDRMLAELTASRAALEREREQAVRLRAESEAARDEYRVKLERLHERRDKLMGELRADLDRSFKDAHAQVAAVIRSLQQGGTARDAAHARERLLALQERANESTREAAGEDGGAAAAADDAEELALGRVDWSRARPGDRVFARGGRAATVLALPDRRGRVRVQIGTARLEMPADQLGAAPEPREGPKPRRERAAHVRFELAAADARRLLAPRPARAPRRRRARARRPRTRRSGREGRGPRLRDPRRRRRRPPHRRARAPRPLPYVLRFEDAEPNEGGDGVTIAILAEL